MIWVHIPMTPMAHTYCDSTLCEPNKANFFICYKVRAQVFKNNLKEFISAGWKPLFLILSRLSLGIVNKLKVIGYP